MKITLAQLNFHIGNFEQTIAKMLDAIAHAKSDGAQLICFAELATVGYPTRDFLEFDNFIQESDKVLEALKHASEGIAIAVGAPTRNPELAGKDLFNSAVFIANGAITHVQHKALLPTYDIFDEYRYFERGTDFQVVEWMGKKIALTVCEDIWDLPLKDINEEDPLYTICPLDEMQSQQPDIILNLSASPFDFQHAAKRIKVVRANAVQYNLPLFYVNHVGAQTEIIFDGGSIVMSPTGELYDEMPYFEECIRTYDLSNVVKGRQCSGQPKDKIALIHDAVITGISNYFGKLGFSKAILGLSGGIDSAVATVLTAKALGAENVRVLLMPSKFSSDHSVKDAVDLAKNLGIQYDIISIEENYDTYLKTLGPYFAGTEFNVAEENLQARIRGMLLMAFSNKFGHILLNTTNKSEMAVGYGTLYGDLCGGLSVIGDIYKTDVFKLARYINKEGEVIPENTIVKPPSAELRPDQKDSDSLPEYDILDTILQLYIEKRLGPKEIIEQGYEEQLVRRILRLVNINEFKRYQTAPVLRVSSKAFGMGRRVPIVAKYLS